MPVSSLASPNVVDLSTHNAEVGFKSPVATSLLKRDARGFIPGGQELTEWEPSASIRDLRITLGIPIERAIKAPSTGPIVT